MKHYKLLAEFLLTAFAGGLLGMFVQLSAYQSGGWYAGDPISSFGLVSYGLFFWVTICTLRAYHSRCGLHAALLVLSLLIPALAGYTAMAYLWYIPLNHAVVLLGILLLLPAAVAAWILRAARRYPVSRVVVRALGTAVLLFDLCSRIQFRPLPLLTEIALFAWFLYITRDLNAEKNRIPAASGICMN